jgi:hypothetical protein
MRLGDPLQLLMAYACIFTNLIKVDQQIHIVSSLCWP